VFTALFETTAANLLGATGALWLRRGGLAAMTASGGASVSLARAVTHPVDSTIILGNAVIFRVSRDPYMTAIGRAHRDHRSPTLAGVDANVVAVGPVSFG
jgi:hypothetical protein